MAVPKKKTSRRRTRQRRANHGIMPSALVVCPQCNDEIPSHKACPTCGYYRNIKVVDVETKLDKKLKKRENSQKEE